MYLPRTSPEARIAWRTTFHEALTQHLYPIHYSVVSGRSDTNGRRADGVVLRRSRPCHPLGEASNEILSHSPCVFQFLFRMPTGSATARRLLTRAPRDLGHGSIQRHVVYRSTWSCPHLNILDLIRASPPIGTSPVNQQHDATNNPTQRLGRGSLLPCLKGQTAVQGNTSDVWLGWL